MQLNSFDITNFYYVKQTLTLSSVFDSPDIDECVSNQGLGPCMVHCHNSPGSYRCSCGYGYILAGDGHSCIAECPPGYRKQQITSTLREECVGE